MHLETALLAARRAAAGAGMLALRRQAEGVSVETKADLSPVTSADKESERFIVAELERRFPDTGILGEEGAARGPRDGYRWIIDPIDGTRDFLRGNPLWAVLIGLESLEENRVVAGVARFPALGVEYYAARGLGAYANEQPIRASSIADPSQAVLCFNSLDQAYGRDYAPRLLEWVGRFWSYRCLGGAADAMLVASGKAEVWVEPSAKPWDLAPIQVMAEEAGARFFNFDHGASIHGGNCVVCTPGLEREVKRFLAG